MILTGMEIEQAVAAGGIVIDPFRPANVGPNSYDFRLGSRYRRYTSDILDARSENPSVEATIPDDGLLLTPDAVTLVNTEEVIGSSCFVPIIRGRSSVGRLGLFIHITADIIDLGSVNQLTLQLHAVTPIKIYSGMLIGQVTFWVPQGEIIKYTGKYGQIRSPSASLIHLDRQ